MVQGVGGGLGGRTQFRVAGRVGDLVGHVEQLFDGANEVVCCEVGFYEDVIERRAARLLVCGLGEFEVGPVKEPYAVCLF